MLPSMLSLSVRRLAKDPIAQFQAWYDAACRRKEMLHPDGMVVSTLDPDGWPSGRMVLLKAVDDRGFVFYTDTRSPKGRALAALPRAALTFYWEPFGRQVRVVGLTSFVAPEEADAYFATRPRLSQLGAWSSFQSRSLPNRMTLVARVAQHAAKYLGRPVPRPPYWTGIRVAPRTVEFWQERPNRLHDRFLYTRGARGGWRIERLSP